MIEVSGPAAVWRDGLGPVFQVQADESVFLALEVATQATLLLQAARSQAGSSGFYGTWSEGQLRPAGAFQLPPRIWQKLRTAPRLHYRAVTSSRADEWVDVSYSVPDDRLESAPYVAVLDVAHPAHLGSGEIERVWEAAVTDPQVSSVARADGAEALIVQHATSPRRPRSPSSTQWVVCVASPANGGMQEVVSILPEVGLKPSGTRIAESPVGSMGGGFDNVAEKLRDRALADAVKRQVDSFELLGTFQVWQDLAPSPAEGVGGTVILSGNSGRILFAATTAWQGGDTAEK